MTSGRAFPLSYLFGNRNVAGCFFFAERPSPTAPLIENRWSDSQSKHAVMRLLLLINVIFLAFWATVASASKSKRQIRFEDNDSSSRNPDSDCLTLDRQPGRCIGLPYCTPLRHITRWERLQPYTCGFVGTEPQVCCPFVVGARDSVFTTTTWRPQTRRTRPTRRRPTTEATRRPVTERPVTSRPVTSRPVTTRPVTSRPVTPRPVTPRPTPSTRPTAGELEERPRFLPPRCGLTRNLTRIRVVGGKEAEPGAWPWMAVVFVEKRNGNLSPDCGGALVTNRHIITAAHCIVSGRGATTMNPRLLSVRLGAHDLSVENEPNSVQIGVAAVHRHERFDPRTYKNDIAVLRLNREVRFTNAISPVCLPYGINFTQEALTGKSSTVTGFGTTEFNGRSSDVLREATFDIRSQELCRKAYERELNITSEYMCAGTDDGEKDSCQGDSGGPLVTLGPDGTYYLAGVVSFGKLCAQPGYPGVYTRITKYLNWLRTHLAD